MTEIASQYYPKETGSSLIGFYSDDAFDAFVTNISPVPHDSISSRATFLRGKKGIREFFSRLRKGNANDLHYVGEWHSHPGGLPEPSHVDKSTQMGIARDKKVGCAENVLIIIGGNLANATNLKVFIFSDRRGQISLIADPAFQ